MSWNHVTKKKSQGKFIILQKNEICFPTKIRKSYFLQPESRRGITGFNQSKTYRTIFDKLKFLLPFFFLQFWNIMSYLLHILIKHLTKYARYRNLEVLQHGSFLVLFWSHKIGPFPAISEKPEKFISFSSYSRVESIKHNITLQSSSHILYFANHIKKSKNGVRAGMRSMFLFQNLIGNITFFCKNTNFLWN